MAGGRADAIIFVVDSSTGITGGDEGSCEKILRKRTNPMFLVSQQEGQPRHHRGGQPLDFCCSAWRGQAHAAFRHARLWHGEPASRRGRGSPSLRTSLRMTRTYSRPWPWAIRHLYAKSSLITAARERSAIVSMLRPPSDAIRHTMMISGRATDSPGGHRRNARRTGPTGRRVHSMVRGLMAMGSDADVSIFLWWTPPTALPSRTRRWPSTSHRQTGAPAQLSLPPSSVGPRHRTKPQTRDRVVCLHRQAHAVCPVGALR